MATQLNCEIFCISLGDTLKKDVYFFYEDGRIKRLYDIHSWNYTIKHFVTPEAIPDEKKIMLIAKCPEHYLSIVSVALGL